MLPETECLLVTRTLLGPLEIGACTHVYDSSPREKLMIATRICFIYMQFVEWLICVDCAGCRWSGPSIQHFAWSISVEENSDNSMQRLANNNRPCCDSHTYLPLHKLSAAHTVVWIKFQFFHSFFYSTAYIDIFSHFSEQFASWNCPCWTQYFWQCTWSSPIFEITAHN
jgi:hypothetical protein